MKEHEESTIMITKLSEVLINHQFTDVEREKQIILHMHDLLNVKTFIPVLEKDRTLSNRKLLQKNLHLTDEQMNKVYLFTTIDAVSGHQRLIYSRKVIAFRVLQTISELLVLADNKRIAGIASSVRLTLENITSFYQSIFNIIRAKVNKINKINNNNSLPERDLNINKHAILMEIVVYLEQIVINTQVDWFEYCENRQVKKYTNEEGFRDISFNKKFNDQLKALDKIKKPHNAEGWELVYKFLCDFCHPSIGSRIAGNVQFEGQLKDICDIRFKNTIMRLQPTKDENNLIEYIFKDLLSYLLDLLNIYKNIDDEAEKIQKELMFISKGFIRDQFMHDRKFYKYVKSNWPQYDEYCVCLSPTKFKFCCQEIKDVENL